MQFQLGKKANFGQYKFRLPGYFPSRFETASERHEAYLTRVLSRLFAEREGAFIDIGVNIGQTLAKVLSVDHTRRYIGFEPQLTCSFNVEQFLKLNDLHNATILPVALSDTNGMLAFYADSETDEMASLFKKDDTAPPSYVQARVGDEVLAEMEIDEVCAIKIDVEGAELHVLHGLKHTLTEKRPVVIFEMLPNFSGIEQRVMNPPEECKANQALADAIYAFFEELQYHIYVINEKDGSEIKIDRFNLDDMENYCGFNYIARSVSLN